ncbi:hypothetical protein PTNB85_01324 [Pyrenophora teres f. teres]|nr:hypothetical protein HRS9139_01321 [Pyrenophora teres f. teres]KAE8850908.1 hypothetical protein PTNB85_01324 [Pyrenophora teres f. teres]KAE8869733.1 hypothetical protein PTNB29_00077 [Pyrenophora teres f. teres]
MKYPAVITALLAASVHAWMPAERDLAAFNQTSDSLTTRAPSLPSYKIRGVNLGGWLISEPWMMGDEWKLMGCGGQCSEFDCVKALGQTKADSAFDAHYARWITPDMVTLMYNAGLNTIRIPIGYWSLHSLVTSGEYFPNVNLKYLDAVIQRAAELGMFVVIDLHGAPGAQKVGDAFTGQVSLSPTALFSHLDSNNPPQCLPQSGLPAFYTQQNYDRATKWLTWMTKRIHTTPSYAATIGIIQVVNEPQTNRDSGGMPQAEKDTLTQIYYPSALRAVRTAENDLGIASNSRLHVQFMDTLWGAGSPSSSLPTSSDPFIMYDDHNYVGGAVTATHPNAKQADYMYYTCNLDNRLSDNDVPKLVGEWSLTVSAEYSAEFDWKIEANVPFYKQWFVAQQRLYERTNGWIFWSWRTQLNDPRWDYSYLVYKGWVPTTAAGLEASSKQDVCKSYFGTRRRVKRWE